MRPELPRVAARCTVMLTGAGVVAGAVWLLVADSALDLARRLSDAPGGLATLPFEMALTGVCSILLLGCAAWFLLVASLVAAEALTTVAGATTASWVGPRLCPATLHRLALGCCGAALVGGLATAPALADGGGSTVLDGLAVPDRTSGSIRPSGSTVLVNRGDSLWSLAKQALPEQADDLEITAAWHAIHLANLDLVGEDPGLIFPGTALRIPGLDPSHREEPS